MNTKRMQPIFYTFKNLYTGDQKVVKINRAQFRNLDRNVDLFYESAATINEAGYKRRPGRWGAEQGSTFIDDETGEHIKMFRNKKPTIVDV